MFHLSPRTFVTGKNVTRTMKLLVVAAKLVAWKKTRLPFEPPFWKKKMPNWKPLWMRWRLIIPLARWKMKSYRRNWDSMRTKSSSFFFLLERKAPKFPHITLQCTKLHYILEKQWENEQKQTSKLWMKAKAKNIQIIHPTPFILWL